MGTTRWAGHATSDGRPIGPPPFAPLLLGRSVPYRAAVATLHVENGTFTSPGSTASGPRSFSGGTPNVTAPWLTCSATRARLGLAGRGRWSASCSPCDCALVGFRPGDVPGVPVLLR